MFHDAQCSFTSTGLGTEYPELNYNCTKFRTLLRRTYLGTEVNVEVLEVQERLVEHLPELSKYRVQLRHHHGMAEGKWE